MTARSDLYSLGILGHELLTGARPFDRGTPIATAIAHLEEPPPPLPAGVPAELAAVIDACLAKRPEDRPASAEAVGLALTMSGGAQPLRLDAERVARRVTPSRAVDKESTLGATASLWLRW